VINAGDGWHAHPTQALLDLFTIRDRKGTVDGLKVAIVGDIKHSRVARSNTWALHKMGAKVTLCGPPTLIPYGLRDDSAHFPRVTIATDVGEAVTNADVVMALRLQKERQQAGELPSIREYVLRYKITPERLEMAKPDAVVLHPGPVNEEVEISQSVVNSPQSVINEQVANGVAVRMALLYLIAGTKS
jgi:aspartate carbamoyltransferase catalytic subunit